MPCDRPFLGGPFSFFGDVLYTFGRTEVHLFSPKGSVEAVEPKAGVIAGAARSIDYVCMRSRDQQEKTLTVTTVRGPEQFHRIVSLAQVRIPDHGRLSGALYTTGHRGQSGSSEG